MEKSKKIYILRQLGYHATRWQIFLNFSIFLQIRYVSIKYFYQIVLCVIYINEDIPNKQK